MSDRLWVNDERTVLVRLWASGTVEVAWRVDKGCTWGPPVLLAEEDQTPYRALASSRAAITDDLARDQAALDRGDAPL